METGLPWTPRRAERIALALVLILGAASALLPPIAQPQDYHQFADARVLALGRHTLPNAADVLTSLCFTAAGAAGLSCFLFAAPAQRLPLSLFFAGLLLTGPGSAWYHLAPSDASLLWDRLAMSLAFAGAVGALATERLGPSAGLGWLLVWLLGGGLSMAVWTQTGDLRLYLIAQFGGLGVMLLWFRLPPATGMLGLPWGWLLLAYLIAKILETSDQAIWAVTNGLISGHPLKHVVAALGVVPILHALRQGPRQGRLR